MVSRHDSCFVWIARDSAVPSIMTISEPVAFIGFGSALKGIALAAATPAAKLRSARRFRSVGSFIDARLSPSSNHARSNHLWRAQMASVYDPKLLNERVI